MANDGPSEAVLLSSVLRRHKIDELGFYYFVVSWVACSTVACLRFFYNEIPASINNLYNQIVYIILTTLIISLSFLC